MRDRNFNNEVNKQEPPIKKAMKPQKEKSRPVKISENHYNIIREQAFKERKTIREILDEIIAKHLSN